MGLKLSNLGLEEALFAALWAAYVLICDSKNRYVSFLKILEFSKKFGKNFKFSKMIHSDPFLKIKKFSKIVHRVGPTKIR